MESETTTQNQRQQLIEQFHQRTGLNRQIAEDTLQRFGWDFDVNKKKREKKAFLNFCFANNG